MRSPVAVPPVKDTSGTLGCPVRALPHSAPKPNTILSTPGGKPTLTASWHSIHAVTEVISDGLQTHVLPVAKAGAIFHVSK